MLNTDFELFYNLTLDTTAKTTCTLTPTCGLSTPNTCSGSCQPATTFSQALGYSKVFIIKILNIFIMLSCTHLYHTSFQYLCSTCLLHQTLEIFNRHQPEENLFATLSHFEVAKGVHQQYKISY